MKKLKDFVYDCNDIIITLLVLAIAAGIIFWRVDGIMAYSDYLEAKAGSETEIDIDFGDIDLTEKDDPEPGEDDPMQELDPEDPEDPIQPEEKTNPVPDANFVSNRQISVSIPKGSGCAKIAAVVADAYGYTDEDYKNFVLAFRNTAKDLKLEEKMHYGDFVIDEGSNLADIIKQLAHVKS